MSILHGRQLCVLVALEETGGDSSAGDAVASQVGPELEGPWPLPPFKLPTEGMEGGVRASPAACSWGASWRGGGGGPGDVREDEDLHQAAIC